MRAATRVLSVRAAGWAVAACLAPLLAACAAPSVHPLYTSSELVFEETLLGDWSEDEDDEVIWESRKGANQSYELILSEKGVMNMALRAHLGSMASHFSARNPL